MAEALPDRARVVVVGGGIVGCSVAYHLTQLGWTDVVLLERKRLTSGTTWHAAGLVTLARPTAGTRELVKRSIRIFEGLEAATGQATGYRRTGTIHLATGPDRWEELQRQSTAGRASELEIEVIDADRAVELFPLLKPDGIAGGLYYPARRPGQRHRHHDGPREGRPGGRCPDLRADQGHWGHDPGHARHRRHDGCRRHRGRGRRQLHRHVGPGVRPGPWRRPSAASPRALLRRHREHPRSRRQPADDQELGRLRLRQGRGGRAHGRLLRAGQPCHGHPAGSRPTRSSPPFRRTGTTSARTTSG